MALNSQGLQNYFTHNKNSFIPEQLQVNATTTVAHDPASLAHRVVTCSAPICRASLAWRVRCGDCAQGRHTTFTAAHLAAMSTTARVASRARSEQVLRIRTAHAQLRRTHTATLWRACGVGGLDRSEANIDQCK